jgi:hypothetical protein
LPKVRTTAKKSTNTEKSQKHILHRGWAPGRKWGIRWESS